MKLKDGSSSSTKSKQDKKVWVEVEVNKYTDGITVFRGQMKEEDLEAWANGELVDCALKLEKTHWIGEKNVCILGKGSENNNFQQYKGDTYIRVDTIMLIFVLRDNSSPSELLANQDNIFKFPGRDNPTNTNIKPI